MAMAGRGGNREALRTVDHRGCETACTRCEGLLVRDCHMDVLATIGELDSETMRCVQCGDVVDAVIRRNRHLRAISTAERLIFQSAVAIQGQVPV